MNENNSAVRQPAPRSRVVIVIAVLSTLAIAVGVLKLGLNWKFFDALVVPCFLVTSSVMLLQCWNLLFREKTARQNIRGRWLYGVCALVSVALGMLQSEPVTMLLFGQFALINLLAFIKPPQFRTLPNAEAL